MSDVSPKAPIAPCERPEISWLWRRWFSFGLVLLCVGLLIGSVLALGLGHLDGASAMALATIDKWIIGLIGLIAILYIGGATASEIVQLVAAARGAFLSRPPPGDGT